MSESRQPLYPSEIYQETIIIKSTIKSCVNDYNITHEIKEIVKNNKQPSWSVNISTYGEISEISKDLEPLDTFKYDNQETQATNLKIKISQN